MVSDDFDAVFTHIPSILNTCVRIATFSFGLQRGASSFYSTLDRLKEGKAIKALGLYLMFVGYSIDLVSKYAMFQILSLAIVEAPFYYVSWTILSLMGNFGRKKYVLEYVLKISIIITFIVRLCVAFPIDVVLANMVNQYVSEIPIMLLDLLLNGFSSWFITWKLTELVMLINYVGILEDDSFSALAQNNVMHNDDL